MTETYEFQDVESAIAKLKDIMLNLKVGNRQVLNDELAHWAGSVYGDVEWKKGSSDQILSIITALVKNEKNRDDFRFDMIEIYSDHSGYIKIKDNLVQLNVYFDINRPGYTGASFFMVGRVGENEYYLVYRIWQ
jgi:hypothetical protein